MLATEETRRNWTALKETVSQTRAFQATEVLGAALAADMVDLADVTEADIDRIYVKLRDGAPMACGIRRVLPRADIRYIVSQEKQKPTVRSTPIRFWDDFDGRPTEIVWYADPINATGHTAIESLKFVRKHF